MILYPAIDLKGGRVVRLRQGRSDQETVYYSDPAIPAREWRDAGAEWLHVVDLDGAFEGRSAHLHLLPGLVQTGLKIELGGGLRSVEAVAAVLEAGIQRAIIGTRAARDEAFIADLVARFGSERIAVGIDAKDGKVAVAGWVDTVDLQALDLARRMDALGVGAIIYTDISRDGMMQGPNFAAQEEMVATVRCPVIASGGVTVVEDLRRLRNITGLHGTIVGKALYEGTVDIHSALAACR